MLLITALPTAAFGLAVAGAMATGAAEVTRVRLVVTVAMTGLALLSWRVSRRMARLAPHSDRLTNVAILLLTSMTMGAIVMITSLLII